MCPSPCACDESMGLHQLDRNPKPCKSNLVSSTGRAWKGPVRLRVKAVPWGCLLDLFGCHQQTFGQQTWPDGPRMPGARFIQRLIENLKYKTLETLIFENQQSRCGRLWTLWMLDDVGMDTGSIFDEAFRGAVAITAGCVVPVRSAGQIRSAERNPEPAGC